MERLLGFGWHSVRHLGSPFLAHTFPLKNREASLLSFHQRLLQQEQSLLPQVCAPPFSSSKLPCFSNPYSDTSANCLSHLPLYSPLLRAGFNIFPLFFAIFTHPLVSQANFLKFFCVTLLCLLTTRHKHDSHVSWEIQAWKAGHATLPHFWRDHFPSLAHHTAA